MPQLQIRRHDTGALIYDGRFETARSCVEAAVRENICLDYADLRYANLHNAALDGVTMRYARLESTNLAGANISEALLTGTQLNNASLINTCLCETNLADCQLNGTHFGATDITQTTIDRASFSTLSALEIDFKRTHSMQDCRFNINDNTPIAFSRPPITIHGMDWPVYMLDAYMGIGARFKTYTEWLAARNDNINPNVEDGSAYIARFIQMHRQTLLSLASFHNRHIAGTDIYSTKTA